MTQGGAKTLYAAIDSGYKPTELDKELYRLDSLGVGVQVMNDVYNIFSFTKNKQEYRLKVPGEDLYAVYADLEKRFRQAMTNVISSSAYQNATALEKKDMLSDAKSDVRKVVREELKAGYGYEVDDDFAKMVRMK